MSNCKSCKCPLTRLLDAKGKPEKRTKCIRCAVISKPSVSIVPCPPNANAAQGKKSLLIGSRQAVVAARRAYYERTRKDSPTAGDS